MMIELKMLVKSQKLALVLVWHSIEWQSYKVISRRHLIFFFQQEKIWRKIQWQTCDRVIVVSLNYRLFHIIRHNSTSNIWGTRHAHAIIRIIVCDWNLSLLLFLDAFHFIITVILINVKSSEFLRIKLRLPFFDPLLDQVNQKFCEIFFLNFFQVLYQEPNPFLHNYINNIPNLTISFFMDTSI